MTSALINFIVLLDIFLSTLANLLIVLIDIKQW
jgi:hypothetical protein